MATFTGAPASDHITPTAFSGSVYADPAGSRPSDLADILYGLGGNDYLDAAGGNDALYGGSGDDTVHGGAGDDYIDDYALADSGGNDFMDGGAGNDTIYARTGDDSLLGSDGADVLYGQDGYDTLDGGTGADTMYGGTGGDAYYVDNVGDVVSETDDNYWYSDRVYASLSFSLGNFFEDLYLIGGSNTNGTGNKLDNRIEGNSAANTLSGENGNDTLDGGAGADTLIGGNGDDIYYVDSADTLIEGANGGIDTVYARSTYTLAAQVENLSLAADVSAYGNSLANVLSGNGYSGALYGLDGNDTLKSDWAAPTLIGGNGDDYYEVYEAGSIVESVGGGTDTVEIDLHYDYGNNVYILEANVENVIVNDEYYYYGYYSYDSYIEGNSSANVIHGGEGSNDIRGMNGADTIYGGYGQDVIDGGGGQDYIDGGYDTDTVVYTANTTPVRVDLAAGLASFLGQSWPSETLVSIENADGGSGNDIFVGSSVDNAFYGNGGNDTFDGAGGTDFFDGGAGSDTLLYTANTTAVNVNLATGIGSFPGKTWPSESFVFIENVSTGSAADTLVGSSAANTLRGSGGGDNLTGAGGADQLIGGVGDDRFIFTALSDSTSSVRDTIAAGDGAIAFEKAGVSGGDKIDLSAIDADTTSQGTNQAFLWGTTKTKGHLWAETSGTTTLIRGNTDGDTAIEIEIAIADAGVLANKYIAGDFTL